jgi:hypothetical protein
LSPPSFAAIEGVMALSPAARKGIANVVDPELWDVIKRYTLVGVVLVAASIWTIAYTTDATQKAITAPTLEARTAPEALDAGPGDVAANGENTKMDTARTVVRHGLLRVRCEAACDLEAQCGLRTRAACINESCEGDVRKLNKSDLFLARAEGCEAIAATPCEEACWRQAECKDDHSGDDACTEACTKLMKSKPSETWLQARCILETKSCDAVALCRP